jgi:hypothetical protein
MRNREEQLQLQLRQPLQPLITMEEQEAMALREARQPPQTARAPQLVRRQHLHLAQAVAVAAVARVLKAVAAVVVAAVVRQLHVL